MSLSSGKQEQFLFLSSGLFLKINSTAKFIFYSKGILVKRLQTSYETTNLLTVLTSCSSLIKVKVSLELKSVGNIGVSNLPRNLASL